MFLFFLFVLLCFILCCLILVQQGKGGMGLETIARSSQTLFGGTGGQDFFTKSTWILGGLFILSALSFSMFNGQLSTSRIAGKQLAPETVESAPVTTDEQEAQESKES